MRCTCRSSLLLDSFHSRVNALPFSRASCVYIYVRIPWETSFLLQRLLQSLKPDEEAKDTRRTASEPYENEEVLFGHRGFRIEGRDANRKCNTNFRTRTRISESVPDLDKESFGELVERLRPLLEKDAHCTGCTDYRRDASLRYDTLVERWCHQDIADLHGIAKPSLYVIAHETRRTVPTREAHTNKVLFSKFVTLPVSLFLWELLLAVFFRCSYQVEGARAGDWSIAAGTRGEALVRNSYFLREFMYK